MKGDNTRKVSRLVAESQRIRARWKDVFRAGDPYYNPNFSTSGLFCEKGTAA